MSNIITERQVRPIRGFARYCYHEICWSPKDSLKARVLAAAENTRVVDEDALEYPEYCWQTRETFERLNTRNPLCSHCKTPCLEEPTYVWRYAIETPLTFHGAWNAQEEEGVRALLQGLLEGLREHYSSIRVECWNITSPYRAPYTAYVLYRRKSYRVIAEGPGILVENIKHILPKDANK